MAGINTSRPNQPGQVLSDFRPKQRSGRPRKVTEERMLDLRFGPVMHQFVQAVACGEAREIACYGTRGDGKTIGILAAMIGHAAKHDEQKYDLPVRWIGVTDTFASHKIKTVRSLELPLWKGCWKVYDGGHLAVARVNGREIVHLDLFGIEDEGAKDRVRMETVGVWFEEPAPTAVLVSSRGVDEFTWSIAITSQRLPSHCHPAVMTLNYPDEDHWTWRRFGPQPGTSGVSPDMPTRRWFRIPPGETASADQRKEWAEALKERPDLKRRLLDGQPGTVLLGPQVAVGFREDLHVAKARIEPVYNEPIFIGQDFGHTPATIIGQVWRGQLRVLFAAAAQKAGIRQHYQETVLPWILNTCPWVRGAARTMICGCYDPSGETGEQSDLEANAVAELERQLPGLWWPGPIKWESRKHTLIASFNRHVRPGELALQIDPVEARDLVKALSSRWHYPQDRQGQVSRDLPKKPNHPWEDLGDAFIYWLWGLTTEHSQPATITVETEFALGGPVGW